MIAIQLKNGIPARQRAGRLGCQRGVSTVQIAVAILVGAILILGGLGSFRYVTQSTMNNDMANMSDLVSLTKQYSQTRGGTTAFTAANITTANLAGLNFFPTTSGSGAATIASMSSGKAISAGPINVDTGTTTSANGVRYTVVGYTGNECLDLVPKVSGLVNRIEIPAGTLVKANGATFADATLTTACKAANDNVTITMDVRG